MYLLQQKQPQYCVVHDNIEMVLVSQEKGSDQSRNLKMDDLGLVIKLRVKENCHIRYISLILGINLFSETTNPH